MLTELPAEGTTGDEDDENIGQIEIQLFHVKIITDSSDLEDGTALLESFQGTISERQQQGNLYVIAQG